MKIALIGYGKMGKMIEEIALNRGHEIVLKISSQNLHELTEANLQKADVAIEYSVPKAAIANIQLCINANVPVVVGTTGWNEQMKEIEALTLAKGAAVLHGSNFSVGMNMFFSLNAQLAKMMNQFKQDYNVSMTEIHHIHKLDAPSGTAITLAEGVLDNFEGKKKWDCTVAPKSVTSDPNGDSLTITAIREGEVPGTHIIKYSSGIDDIEIQHCAHNRKGFALGSVLAGEWLLGKKGFYNVKEMFNF